mmetsp:Transcript_38752/g.121677  ORF Transcript_38752/g.121677 Transcript_38752/m.121677 type:complete len:536 (+) Transcript_38752:45-1652(+)
MLCLLPLTAALHAPVRAPGTLRASAPFVSVSAALHAPVRATPIVLRSAAPSLSISTPRAVGEPIRVGIVGCGRIGIVHLETLRKCPKAKVVSIGGSSREETVSALADKYGIAHFAKDADEVIRNPDVDAVWICSPSQYHAAQIRLAAELGKDIFCEKPIATDLAETIKAVNLCRAKGVKLMTALQRRFDPNFSRVKRSIAEGTIGETIVVKLCSRDPAPPPLKYVQGGGGIFKDMAIHDLDMARFLMASEPVAVLASGSCQVSPEISALEGPEAFDTANVMVRFANGKDAIIDVCRQAPYGYDQRAEVLGTKGMMMTDNMHPSTARILSDKFCGHADMPYDFFMSRYKEAYKQETLAFVQALRRDEPAPCSGRDGLVALIMAIGAGISAEEGRWVRFEEVLQREGIGGMRVSEEGGETAGGGAGWISTMLGSVTPSANPRKEDDLREIFLLFDTDDDDLLTEKEVGEATKLLCKDGACPIYTAEEVHSMVRGVDSDRDGRITFDEFLALWRRAGNIEGAAVEANPFAKLLAPLLK